MFELSVACKYLMPRWRQLSVSIISLVSILVIALVVWLIVVFFSVKDGLENGWVDKIVTLTAPVRVVPTDKYYDSYYYLSDSISSASNYTLKSLAEKLSAPLADPYNSEIDEELPPHWPKREVNLQGSQKDLAKLVVESASSIKEFGTLTVSDYETTLAHLKLKLLRSSIPGNQSQQVMEHASYVGTFDSQLPAFARMLLSLTSADLHNLLKMQAISAENVQEDTDVIHTLDPEALQKRLKEFFAGIEIQTLKTPTSGWRIPVALLPKDATWKAVAIYKENSLQRIFIPMKSQTLSQMMRNLQTDNLIIKEAQLDIKNGKATLVANGQAPKLLAPTALLMLEPGVEISATLIDKSLEQAKDLTSLLFSIQTTVQGTAVHGQVSLGRLEIANARARPGAQTAFAVANADGQGIHLPNEITFGEGILLPRAFREGGARVGDQGFLAYYSPTVTSVQEQRVPVFVAGFYDPGIMPMGGKYILASKNLTALIRASYNHDDARSNGLNIRFDDISKAMKVKAALQGALDKAGVAQYWKIESYHEYEFTKDLIQQLQSEKNLFSLISLIIIIVACSNIISMLVILVNDKKLEIGILRSMGASSGSIAMIFGVCGMVMGTLGSLIGTAAALLTLRNLNELIHLVSLAQGHDLFNPAFYGNSLPSELSNQALLLVIGATAAISLLAGIVPAIKASMLRPSTILRAE